MLEAFDYLLQQITALADYAGLSIFVLLVAGGMGVPVSEDIIVLAAGVLAHREVVTPMWWAWLLCYGGVVISDWMVVYIGRHFGKAILHRRWFKRLIHPRRLLWARRQVHDHGAWVVAASRFIPGFRWPTLFISGTMHLKLWKFAIFDCVAAALSVTIQFMLGWLFSSSVGTLMEYRYELSIGLAAFGLGVLVTYFTYRFRTRAERRSKST